MTIYAFKTPADGWVELGAWTLVPGLAKPDLNGDRGSLRTPPGWAEGMSAQERAEWGAVAVVEVEPPSNLEFRVAGSTIEEVGGVPTQIWIAVAIPLDEMKEQALVDAGAVYDAKRTSPLSWDFGATGAVDDLGDSAGAAGVQTLQMRETPRDDMKNWLAVQAGAVAALLGGAPGTVIPIKVTSNVWVQTTATHLLQVLVAGDGAQLSALQRGAAQLARFGVIKAMILQASTKAEVLAAREEIPVGYPA